MLKWLIQQNMKKEMQWFCFQETWRIQDESEFEERNKGKRVIYRENNTVFMKPWFVNDIAEGEFTERDRTVIRKDCLYEGWKRGLFIELDDKEVELSHCFYGNRILVSDLKKSEQINANGILFPYPNTLLIEHIRRNLLLVWEWCMFEEVSI